VGKNIKLGLSMPTILELNGFRFFFYANEHLPIHVHVSKAGASAKVELVPEIDIIYNRGFRSGK
jgi:hypothetical protein